MLPSGRGSGTLTPCARIQPAHLTMSPFSPAAASGAPEAEPPFFSPSDAMSPFSLPESPEEQAESIRTEPRATAVVVATARLNRVR